MPDDRVQVKQKQDGPCRILRAEEPQLSNVARSHNHAPWHSTLEMFTRWAPLSPSLSSDNHQAQPDGLDGPSTPAALANPAEPELRPRTFIAALATLAAIACAVLAFALYQAATVDPYTQAVLVLDGDPEQGGRLFRINCAGCHGLAAQGLVGPDLHGVTDRKNDPRLVRQVVSGRTPPMPRF